MIQPDTTETDADDGTVLPDDTDTTEDSEDMADMTTADTDDADAGSDEDVADGDADTFPRSYVVKLRTENAQYRERARSADTYAERLHTELVRATGKLADPTDLEFAEEHLDDPDALAAALGDLLARKPHLASRRPTGDIGQGASPVAASSVDLAALLRQRAR